MTETQNEPTEKPLYYFNKPIGEERSINYTKENSLYENQYRVYTWLRRIGKCVVCGDSFRGNNNSYCSQRCINDAAMLAVKVARLKKRTNAKTLCPSCGQAFTIAKSGRIRKFCSNKCRQRAHRVLRNAVRDKVSPTALCNGLQVAHSRPKNTSRANTAKALAEQYGVSERTIRRDGKRAEAIERMLAACVSPRQKNAVC
jgi:endogenous inhibitor of DNA gyrase (YacG/DUF329 family)